MRVAINGLGRIGRTFLRIASGRKDIDIVAVNDRADVHTLAHLIKYDSVHGVYPHEIQLGDNCITVAEKEILVYNEPDPGLLPWKELAIDVVIEATGKFLTTELAGKHLKAGARQVILSAPAQSPEIPVVVLGVNDKTTDFLSPIISNASCTTNNIAPMIKVLDEYWGIDNGYITTVHSMTGDQNLHDALHRDLRRARAASSSIIPTSTGAAKAITSIFPHLNGRLGGAGIRVPVLNGSLTDFTCTLKRQPTVDEINTAFCNAAKYDMPGVLYYTEDPIVSVDIINNSHSCVFDSLLTSVVGGITKVVGWYDNEFGYSSRLLDLLARMDEARS